MAIFQRVVPRMRAEGNHQWDDVYPNPEVFARDIQKNQLWASEVEGVLAGVAAITAEQEHEYGQADWDLSQPAITVHRLAVDPLFRGMGIASALMRQAETVAQSCGISLLRANTDTTNDAVQRLLPRLGYGLSGSFTLDFRPGQLFLCYEKRLPAIQLSPVSSL